MTDSAAVLQDIKQGQAKNLALATLAFTISFWAWNMIAPLGVRYTEELGLTSGEKSLLVATPVLVGSLGRILAGALTDRFGGRLMFTVLLVATSPFVRTAITRSAPGTAICASRIWPFESTRNGA